MSALSKRKHIFPNYNNQGNDIYENCCPNRIPRQEGPLMKREIEIMLLNLPSPPNMDVYRDWAGGFGTSWPAKRKLYGQSADPYFYPFLAYASAVLHEQNCEFSVLDGQKLKLSEYEILRIVKKKSPDLVISLLALPSLKRELYLLNEIKNILPNTMLVAVGTSCRVLHHEILEKSNVDLLSTSKFPYVSNLDFLVNAVVEETETKKIPSVSFKRDGKILKNTEVCSKSLSSLAPPRYEELDLNGYEQFIDVDGKKYRYIPVVGSIGCESTCYYCPYPLGFGNHCEWRSPEDVVNEIDYLSSRNIEGFQFRDQSFAYDEKRALKICELMTKRKNELPWFCEERVNNINRTILEQMKKAGCKTILLGVETGDESLNAAAKPKANLNIIRKAFKLAKEFRISTMAHIIFGWPTETFDTMRRTASFVEELAPDRVNWNYLTPYPGTALRKIAEAQKLVVTNDWSKYTSHNVVMRSKWLSAEQISAVGEQIIHNYNQKKERAELVSNLGKKPFFVFRKLARSLIGKKWF